MARWGRRRAANLVLNPEHESFFGNLELPAERLREHARRDPLRLLVFLGRKLLSVLDHFTTMVAMLGQVVLDAGFLVRQPARIPWREISSNIYRTGT